MKKIFFIILTCLAITGCSTTTKTFPVFYSHSPSTEFEILGTILVRSNNSIGYNTIFEEAKKQYPSTDFVIDIMIDQHVITTSYHLIAYFFRQIFGTSMKKEQTRYEYTIRGTAIQYIRKTRDGEIITAHTPSASTSVYPQNNITVVGKSSAPARTAPAPGLITAVSAPAKKNTTTSDTRSIATFPQSFIGTWKRDEYDNILIFTANSIKSSSSENTANLIGTTADLYLLTILNTSRSFTITIKYINGDIEISGGTGTGQENWNGIWKKQL